MDKTSQQDILSIERPINIPNPFRKQLHTQGVYPVCPEYPVSDRSLHGACLIRPVNIPNPFRRQLHTRGIYPINLVSGKPLYGRTTSTNLVEQPVNIPNPFRDMPHPYEVYL